MRALVLVLLLAACSPEGEQPAAERQVYAGQGRDRLCIAGERGGFLIYGEGNANCSARGRVDRSGESLVLIPDGDADCRIEGRFQGDGLVLGARSDACDYYCGPGADYADKTLTRQAASSPAVDFAGDPLC